MTQSLQIKHPMRAKSKLKPEPVSPAYYSNVLSTLELACIIFGGAAKTRVYIKGLEKYCLYILSS